MLVAGKRALPPELSGLHFYNQRKGGEGEKTTFFLFLCKDVSGKWGTRGWSCPRSQASSWDVPPSEGPWLHAGKNSRVIHSKMKAGVLRERHIP